MINSTYVTRYRWNPIKHTTQYLSSVYCNWMDIFYMDISYCNSMRVIVEYKDTWCEPEWEDKYMGILHWR